jgi:hypothetical protein
VSCTDISVTGLERSRVLHSEDKFVPLAQGEAPALCYRSIPEDDCACTKHAMHGGRLMGTKHFELNSELSDSNSWTLSRAQPLSFDVRSRTSSIASSKSNSSIEALGSLSLDSEDAQDVLFRVSKSVIIEKVMAWFKTWLDSHLALLVYQHEEGSGAEQPPIHSNKQDETKESGSRPSKRLSDKHDRGDSGDESADESNRDDEDHKKRKRARCDSPQKRRFACPFYKHDRLSYQSWRVCSGPGWDTIHRVKCATLVPKTDHC